MTVYFTSDLHLGHTNVIRFCNRPFADADHMNVDILNRIASTVTPDDELWILGDIAMGQIDATIPMVERIPCPVVIVAGNHDRCHPYNGEKHLKWIDRYANLRNVTDLHLGNTSLTLASGDTVVVSHFPYAGNSWERVHDKADKYAQYRAEDVGEWLLCGHVHDAWRQQNRQINVGVDAWGGYPISEHDIAQIIANGPANLPPVPWETR